MPRPPPAFRTRRRGDWPTRRNRLRATCCGWWPAARRLTHSAALLAAPSRETGPPPLLLLPDRSSAAESPRRLELRALAPKVLTSHTERGSHEALQPENERPRWFSIAAAGAPRRGQRDRGVGISGVRQRLMTSQAPPTGSPSAAMICWPSALSDPTFGASSSRATGTTSSRLAIHTGRPHRKSPTCASD